MTGTGYSWIYQARRVATHAVADGYSIIDISLASGQTARLISVRAYNSGTNGIVIELHDEDDAAHSLLANVASAAATYCNLPSIGSSAGGSGNIINSLDLTIPSGAKLSIAETVNCGAGDTLTLSIVFELFNMSTEPTWSIARSTGTAPSLAASTISAANTLTLGRIWA